MTRSNLCHANFAQQIHKLSKHNLQVYSLCGRKRLLTAMQFRTTLHTSYGRRRLLLAILFFTLADLVETGVYHLHTLCGRRRLLTAAYFLTILHTSRGRRRLLTPIDFLCVLYQIHIHNSSFRMRSSATVGSRETNQTQTLSKGSGRRFLSMSTQPQRMRSLLLQWISGLLHQSQRKLIEKRLTQAQDCAEECSDRKH